MDFVALVVVAVVAAALTAAAAYNGLADGRQAVRDAWSALDAALRRRADGIAPLAALARVAGETPADLTVALSAKNQAAVAFNPRQLAEAESALTGALTRLLAEPPPDLSSQPGFGRCKSDLVAAGRALSAEVGRYNDAVATYNATLASVPHQWAAVAFGFKPQLPFELKPA